MTGGTEPFPKHVGDTPQVNQDSERSFSQHRRAPASVPAGVGQSRPHPPQKARQRRAPAHRDEGAHVPHSWRGGDRPATSKEGEKPAASHYIEDIHSASRRARVSCDTLQLRPVLAWETSQQPQQTCRHQDITAKAAPSRLSHRDSAQLGEISSPSTAPQGSKRIGWLLHILLFGVPLSWLSNVAQGLPERRAGSRGPAKDPVGSHFGWT